MNKLYLLVCFFVTFQSCKTEVFRGSSRNAPAIPPLQSRLFKQDSFEVRSLEVKQGNAGANGNELYSVVAKGVVDIVVVVDSSGSMAEEQANLASRLAPLLSAIKDSDWRIVVTTTDPNSDCGRGPLSKGDLLAEARFKNFVNAGVDGTGIERPILQAVNALKGDCFFGPGKWLRSGSTVAVVVVTDEDNCHIDVANGYGCSGQADLAGSYLTNYLASIRKIGTEARVYGIYWDPSQATCNGALKQATTIAAVVKATGGTAGSICDSDYSATLGKISTDVAKIMKSDFALKSVPDPGTFKMTVNGQPWTQFTQVGLLVHFTTNPPVDSAIQVTYVSGAAGVVSNSFPMADLPAGGNVSAVISGRPAGAVTYDAAQKKVVFAETPPSGSVITLSYKIAAPLKKEFSIPANLDPQYIKVYVNDSVVPGSTYSYSGSTGIIAFKISPAESSNIKVEWRGKKEVQG
jgi:hypothetical protein